MKRLFPLLALGLALTACDRLGIPDPAKQAATKEQEGKAIGGACRQSGRALEDCYTLNPTAAKAAIFAGWKEMNDYMQQNKLEVVKPELPPPALTKKKMLMEAMDDAASRRGTSRPEDSEARGEESAPAEAASEPAGKTGRRRPASP